jgi:enoyl-CoA hydratase
MAEEVVKMRIENDVAELVINRPDNLNALNVDVLQSLLLAFEKLNKDGIARCAIITGAGEKAFVAGADIPLLQQLGKRAAADYIELGQRAMREIEKAPFPVLAAVNGYALGGGLELAISCDIILASQSAKFGAPEVNLGIIPGFGATQRLVQRCGIGAARRLIFTGDMIDALEAKSIGLADVIAPEGTLQETTWKMAQMIASRGPLAVAEAKKVIRISQEQVLLSGLQMEVESFLAMHGTADREEGMTAFMQKRKPKFIGK